MDTGFLPPLAPDFEPTRATLHTYALAVAAVPRAHGIAHPDWWHLGLEVGPEGLETAPVPLPAGGALGLRMDLRRHEVLLTAGGASSRFDMRAGATGTEFADDILTAAAEHGLAGPWDRAKFENDSPREYRTTAAEAYFTAFLAVRLAFERHRSTLPGRVSPIQVWPHGFDLSFEWFGSRRVVVEGQPVSTQLNLGFYPGGQPYFYSSPWPFDEALTAASLPPDAVWNTTGWQGALIPYAVIQGAPAGETRLLEFARAVYALAAPGLG